MAEASSTNSAADEKGSEGSSPESAPPSSTISRVKLLDTMVDTFLQKLVAAGSYKRFSDCYKRFYQLQPDMTQRIYDKFITQLQASIRAPQWDPRERPVQHHGTLLPTTTGHPAAPRAETGSQEPAAGRRHPSRAQAGRGAAAADPGPAAGLSGSAQRAERAVGCAEGARVRRRPRPGAEGS
ncbi:polyamine-modulated factor 1 isoform X2 [Oryctolagus cuniculus]|uniref:polyamine-modulated factor 1 isoform X2 n=1 Tax=Oryctolagus cuniculus TaxID=9986 RepID=UPI0038796F0B